MANNSDSDTPQYGSTVAEPLPSTTEDAENKDSSSGVLEPAGGLTVIKERLRKVRISDVLKPKIETPSTTDSGTSTHLDKADNPVDILLKLITEGPRPISTQHPGALGEGTTSHMVAPEPHTPMPGSELNQYLSDQRPVYELGACETLSDVARRFYDEHAVAELIYKINATKIEAVYSRGLKLRLLMVPGTILDLPTIEEAHLFLAQLPKCSRRRTLEYDIV